jgi:dTDP-glucose 4,6-dehydratase
MKLVITGGAGFIGSNFVHYIQDKYPEYKVIVIDNLTYAGNMDNLKGFNGTFIKENINNPNLVNSLSGVDAIVNFAAETHVDNSIQSSTTFLWSNILGVNNLLGIVRQAGIKKYIQISTDEVYGDMTGYLENTVTTIDDVLVPELLDCEPQTAKEYDKLRPSNPYAVTKASADLMCLSHHRTYGTPTLRS